MVRTIKRRDVVKSYFLPESTFPGLFVRTFVWLGLLILGPGAVAKAAPRADARIGNNNVAQPAHGSRTPTSPVHPAPKRLQAKLAGGYPVSFTPLAGPQGARYVSQGIHYALALDSSGLSIATTQSRPAAKAGPLDHAHASNGNAASLPAALRDPQTSSVHVQFLGASPNVRIEGLDPTGAKTNYLIGNNPALWQRNLPSYKRVRYQAIYPGIDLIYYSSMQRKLEYDMVVRPGADPAQIHFRVDGQHQPTIDADGNLVLDGANGTIRLNRPLFYQDIAGKRETTLGTFRQIAKNEFGFAAVPYDHSKPLIIDPTITLLYSTYLGGVNDDEVYGMSVDKTGDAYLVGYSESPNFPVTADAYQSSYLGVDQSHAIIVKFDPSGTVLYSTFLGGTSSDFGDSIAVTPDGEAWIGGTTISNDFPVTVGAYQSNPGGMFLSEISADGSTLLYSTYFGPTGDGPLSDILLNSDGSMWIAGGAGTLGLPVSANAYQQSPKGSDNNFVAKISFSASGSLQVPYLTYFGGSSQSWNSFPFEPLTIDSSGNVYLASATYSSDFPATANALEKAVTLCSSRTTCTSSTEPYSEPFIAKFSPDLSQLLYASEIGGTTSDGQGFNSYPVSIHLDSQGNIWTVGTTGDTNFPVTSNAISQQLNGGTPCNTGGGTGEGGPPSARGPSQSTPTMDRPRAQGTGSQGYCPVGSNEFISELSASGSTLLYGTYLGGSSIDTAGNAVWDPSGNIWISGYSNSSDFPVTSNALQTYTTYAGYQFATLTEISPNGAQIEYSTYFGGGAQGLGPVSNQIYPNYVINAPSLDGLDADGNIHLAGVTGPSLQGSTFFPITNNAFETQFADGNVNGTGYDFGNDIYYAILGSGLIGTVTPATGGNTGDATLTVTGSGFQQGATCSLSLGTTTITSSTASVNTDGTSITCGFPLIGAQPGSYNVQVTNPGGTSVAAANPFTVQSGGAPDIWANMVGRESIRTGTPSTFTVTYGNSGSVDAYFVPLTLYLPPNLAASYFIGVPQGVNISGTTANTSTNGSVIPLFLPHVAAGSSGSFVVTIQDNVPSDTFTITAGYGHPWYTSASAALTDLQAQSSTFTPQQVCAASPSGLPEAGSCLGEYLTGLQGTGLTASQVEGTAGSMVSMLQQSEVGSAPAIGGTTLPASSLDLSSACTLKVTKVPATSNQVVVWTTDVSQTNTEPVNSTDCPPDGGVLPSGIKTLTCTFKGISAPLGQFDDFAGAAEASGGYQGLTGNKAEFFTACFGTSAQVTSSGCTITAAAGNCGHAKKPEQPDKPDPPDPEPEPEQEGDPSVEPCSVYVQDIANKIYDYSIFGGPTQQSIGGVPPCSPENSTTIPGQTVQAYDPNGIIGPNGDGSASHYIRGNAGLPYEIYFENQPSATAPASQVVVTDQLNPTTMNLSTVALGPIIFGANVITPPPGVTNYSTTYSVSSTLSVDVQGSLNPSTGLLKWTFTSIDPSTGQPPTDLSDGFLPPDTDGVSGQGSVQFTVMPNSSQSTGTQITNTATVVFDANAAITTPTWTNTLDVTPPVSHVSPLPPTETAATGGSATFTVSWSGTDVGSGIGTYTIYVSQDGGAYTVWQSNTTLTSATYTASVGHTYSFYSIAMDKAGNVEAPKTAPDTTTQVVPPTPVVTTTTLTASATTVNQGATVTFNVTVAPAVGSIVPTGTVTFLDGSTTLATAPLNASGTTSYTTSTLPVGSDSITAQYSGDSYNAASTSTPLTITVVAPSFSLTSTPASLTIMQGSSGSVTIAATPAAGFSQQISFSCSGLPAYATCSFSPPTVTPNGTSPVSTTLTIATDVKTVALSHPHPPFHHPSRSPALFAVVGLGMLALARARRRLQRSFAALASLGTLALLFALSLGVSGCGGAQDQTPTGTTTVTIQATGGSVTQTTTLTVTIQS